MTILHTHSKFNCKLIVLWQKLNNYRVKKVSKMSLHDQLIAAYDNDGFLYCILTNFNDQNVVKVGKVSMKTQDSDDVVITKLHHRYNTYYPKYEMLYFIRVQQVHKAERFLMSHITDLKLKDRVELYSYNAQRITDAFKKTKTCFPCIATMIAELTPEELTSVNKFMRMIY